MNLFVIRRRKAWTNPEQLEKTASRSAQVGNEQMPKEVRWIRSYVVREESGELGTVCIYQAVSADALREHARRVGMPADEIDSIEGTVIVRDDPQDGDVSRDATEAA